MRLKRYWGLIVLFLFWVVVALPFFGPAYIPTHDGEYHILRIYEFYKVLATGNIIPRWAPGLNSGYGVPLFNFNYPFPNYVGALFHFLGQGYIQSFKLSLISGYGLAILFCYFLFRKRFSQLLALSVTLIFATVPYWFVDVNIRGSIGEVWAICWMMAVMAAIEWEKPKIMALTVGLLIISHNILAMLFVPIIFGYLCFIKKKYLVWLLIGLLTATYFWLPALGEKRYVEGLNSVTFSDHFPSLFQLIIPSWGSGFSAPGFTADEMSQQIGLFALFTFTLTLISVLRKRDVTTEKLFFSTVFIGASFLMLEITIPVWKILAPLQFLQYPWRLLSLTLISVPFLAASIMNKWKSWVVIVACIASIGFSIGYIQPVLYQHRDDSHYLNNRTYTDGTNSLGNGFTTIWTAWKKERPNAHIEILRGDGTIQPKTLQLMSDHYEITNSQEDIIQINRLYYPGWQVLVDKKSVPINYKQNGTLLFTLPPGTHDVRTRFSPTALRFIANSISLLAIITVFIGMIRKNYANWI